jgi:hypothetical protein
MEVGWRGSRDTLARLLRERGQDPDRVTDVATAWQAFRSFLDYRIDGLEPNQASDPDGFIVQWGCYSWNDKLPSLAFTRLFAVDVRATWTEPDWYQPEQWEVNLELVFGEAPALADIGRLRPANTGFDFSSPGPERDNAIREVEQKLARYPALQSLWTGRPSRSRLTFSCVD